MDRNQQARDQFKQGQQQREAAKLQQEFARALSAGQAGVLDRFGQKIEPGTLLLFHPPYDYVYTVVDVAPVLAPNVPPGYVRLTLELKMQATVPVNQPQMTMVSVGKQEAPETANASDVVTPIAPPPTEVGDAEVSALSGQPCGCDPAADHLCERHAQEANNGPDPRD